MRVSIFGLGYVGSVSAACFADLGHVVTAVDKNTVKMTQIAAGTSPIVEEGVTERLTRAVASGSLTVTTSVAEAVARTDVSLVCVGTPSQPNGDVYLGDLKAVCQEVGAAMASKIGYHLIIVTSTVPPGTVEGVLQPLIEHASGKAAGADFGLCMVPEFLREGTAVDDFLNPPKSVIGSLDEEAAVIAAQVYGVIGMAPIHVPIKVAEMVKFSDNAWHALKVSFANEIGRFARAHGVDGRVVMDVFAQDTKLNISRAYLRPGFSFGGSCLPKDVRTLTYRARAAGIDVPVLNSILTSNHSHFEDALSMILQDGSRRVGLLGLSFKAGTDDLRESPMVELAERLLGKGFDLRIFDSNVALSRLVGANRDYILGTIPHISDLLMESLDEVLDHADLLIVGNGAPEFRGLAGRIRPDQKIIDLVGVAASVEPVGVYEGIAW